MKCPNCNSEIRDGSIICPMCNTQFAFTASDNYINLPDDDYVIKSSGVEEYVTPHEGDANPIMGSSKGGVLDLKTKPVQEAPKKVVRVVTINKSDGTNQDVEIEEQSAVISSSVPVEHADAISVQEKIEMDTQVVNVGGFTNTIIDTSTAQKNNETPTVQETTTVQEVPTAENSSVPVFAPTSNEVKPTDDRIQSVDIVTSTIGVENNYDTSNEKPKRKANETMMIALVMGLIVVLLCFIIYILLDKKENPGAGSTTTTMVRMTCPEGVECISTEETTTTESTTTTEERKNVGVDSNIENPLNIGETSSCNIYDVDNNSVLVDFTLEKVYTPEEAEKYMENVNNATYVNGMVVTVLQYKVSAPEVKSKVKISSLTKVTFYDEEKKRMLTLFQPHDYKNFNGGEESTVIGYFNYLGEVLPKYVCFGAVDEKNACYVMR